MLALRRTMILGIAVFLIVLTALLSVGQVVGSASEANATLPPTLVSPANNILVTENDTTPPDPVSVFPPRKWTEFEVKEMEIGGGEFVEINWTASDDPYFKQYKIYILKVPPPILPDMTPNATIRDVYWTTYTTEEPLDSGTTYYISVVVVDQADLSSEAATESVTTNGPLNWPLMGGIAVAVEVAIAAIFVVIKLFIKKE